MKIGHLIIGVLTTIANLVAANVVTDFSSTLNPNGQYSYGQEATLGAGFTLLPNTVSGSGYAGWSGTVSGFPEVLGDTAGSTFTTGTVTFSPDYLLLHPASNGTFAVVRYVIPVAGSYQISGAFRGQDTGGTTTDAHVLFNGVSAFDTAVTGYLDPSKQAFSLVQALNVNDTVDFAVGFGSNGTYFSDSTGLQGTIGLTGVPEPTSVALMLTGVAVLGLLRRRSAVR